MQLQLFTWETLGTLSGSAVLTFFIVQYTKTLFDWISRGLPTDLYAVIVAFIVFKNKRIRSR